MRLLAPLFTAMMDTLTALIKIAEAFTPILEVVSIIAEYIPTLLWIGKIYKIIEKNDKEKDVVDPTTMILSGMGHKMPSSPEIASPLR